MPKATPEARLTYADVSKMFKSNGLPASVRNVKRIIAKNRKLCPVYSDGYHHKRFKAFDVWKLIFKLNPSAKEEGRAKQ